MRPPLQFIFQYPDHHGVDATQLLDECFFMSIRNGRLAAFVKPKHIFRGKAHGEVIAQCTGFLKELDVPRMQDVVASTNKDFFHNEMIYSFEIET